MPSVCHGRLSLYFKYRNEKWWQLYHHRHFNSVFVRWIDKIQTHTTLHMQFLDELIIFADSKGIAIVLKYDLIICIQCKLIFGVFK